MNSPGRDDVVGHVLATRPRQRQKKQDTRKPTYLSPDLIERRRWRCVVRLHVTPTLTIDQAADLCANVPLHHHYSVHRIPGDESVIVELFLEALDMPNAWPFEETSKSISSLTKRIRTAHSKGPNRGSICTINLEELTFQHIDKRKAG